MTRQSVNIGSFANDGTGDTLRNAGTKINANFSELYSAMGDGTTLASGVFVTTLNTVTLFLMQVFYHQNYFSNNHNL